MGPPRKLPQRQKVQIATLHTPRQHNSPRPPTILPTLLESWEAAQVIDFQDKPAEDTNVSSVEQTDPHRRSLVGKRGPQRMKTCPAALAPNPGMGMTVGPPRKLPRQQTVQIATLHT